MKIEIDETTLRMAIGTIKEAIPFCTNKAAQTKLRILRETLEDYLSETLEKYLREVKQ